MKREYASLTTNGELAGCVKAWRRRLTPDTSRATGEWRRRGGNVTQEEMAEVIGVSVVWYSNLERGVRANYSDAFLDGAARALRLSADERVLLYLLAVGRKPPPSPADAAAVPPDGSLRQVVSGQRWPTYVLNRYSRVILHNEPCESYYPWLRDDSDYARWVLTSADARQRLVHWENDWAAPLLAQLRMARAQHPRDTRIATLIDTCLGASPDARRLWDAYADHACPPRSRRGIRLPDDHRATAVDVVTLTDLKPSELRVVVLVPAAEPPPVPVSELTDFV
ncbi:MAG: helix-turn-helix domain-containing protein [Streptosporangiaceae bacterium]|jgi:transcriptional regulator with XRE-family HTH domain